MRIGLMVGSDKERSRADRMTGLLDDGKSRRGPGFRVVLDSAGSRLSRRDDGRRAARAGDRTHRNRHRGRPNPDPPSAHHGAAGADHPGRVCAAGSRSASARRTTGSSPISSGCPTTDRQRLVRDYLDVLDAAFAGPGAVGGGQRELPRAQPGGRHRRFRHAGAHRRARTRDAANRRRTHRRNHPVDGRRTSDRRLRGAAHHRGRAMPRAGPEFGWSQAFPSPCARTTRSTAPATTRARCSVMPTSPPTTFGCSSTVTPKTSATPWRPATSRPSSRGCAATATQASPISPSGWFRLGRTPGDARASRRRTQEFVASLLSEFASGA